MNALQKAEPAHTQRAWMRVAVARTRALDFHFDMPYWAKAPSTGGGRGVEEYEPVRNDLRFRC